MYKMEHAQNDTFSPDDPVVRAMGFILINKYNIQ